MQDQRYAARQADIPVPVKIEDLKDRKTRRKRGERGEKRWSQPPSRSKTGTTPHFKMWTADLRMKSALQKIKLMRLSESIVDNNKLSTAYAVAATAGVKTVWDLASAKREDLLALHGMGEVRLRLLHADLLARNVHPRWEA
jgi:hypothetical protein